MARRREGAVWLGNVIGKIPAIALRDRTRKYSRFGLECRPGLECRLGLHAVTSETMTEDENEDENENENENENEDENENENERFRYRPDR